jgi:hypothetical protein
MSNEEKKIPYGLTEAQASAIRCAHADMAGVYQCAIRDGNGGADNGHDWKAHRASIEELEKEFSDLLEHIPLEDGEDEAPADNAMSDDDWMKEFDPVLNADGSLFEISQNAENFRELVEAQRVWTMLDCDGSLYLSPGVHWVNRMSYHVTNKPWTNESVDVAWDVWCDEDDNEEN